MTHIGPFVPLLKTPVSQLFIAIHVSFLGIGVVKIQGWNESSLHHTP